MNWVVKYVVICVGTIAVLLAVIWGGLGPDLQGLGTQGIVALALGVVFTVAVGVGLMALTFMAGHRRRENETTDLTKPPSA
jgi:ABC-type nickel/cobalt efflux system permease component RcnA